MNRRALRVFYGVVVLVSLVGAVQAAGSWLGWVLPAAALAVAALELGGIVLANHAARRRELGEAATVARLVSALVACAAVTVQIAGHADKPAQAGFFAVMSALGYVTYLIDAEAQRRDALRARGLLAEVPPRFGLLQWLREPRITRRARVLAQERAAMRLDALQRRAAGEIVAMPVRLDALAALAAARREARVANRQAAIARVLRRTIGAAVDKDTAEIAVAVYDLDEIAARLTERADYETLTDLVGAGLAPARLAGSAAGDPAPVDQVDALDADPAPVDQVDALDAVDVTERLFAAHGTPLVIDGAARKVESASPLSDAVADAAPVDVPAWAPVPATADAARVSPAAVVFVAPPAPVDPAPVDQVDALDADPAPVDQVDALDADPAPVDQVDAPDADPADDTAALRADARKVWRDTVQSGTPLSGAALGRRFGLSARWGQERVREARRALASEELPGQLALTELPPAGAVAADRGRELVGAGK